jgi:hypothetical protein
MGLSFKPEINFRLLTEQYWIAPSLYLKPLLGDAYGGQSLRKFSVLSIHEENILINRVQRLIHEENILINGVQRLIHEENILINGVQRLIHEENILINGVQRLIHKVLFYSSFHVIRPQFCSFLSSFAPSLRDATRMRLPFSFGDAVRVRVLLCSMRQIKKMWFI